MEFLENADDARLKPRVLRSLLRDRLPDEKRPFLGPSQLLSVLSLVRAHGLLSESLPRRLAATEAPPRLDKQAAAWSAAVDAWVERCLALSSSKMVTLRSVQIKYEDKASVFAAVVVPLDHCGCSMKPICLDVTTNFL